MRILDASTILDREQLRDVTLNDEELMREVLLALIDDTSRQIPLIENAIRSGDSRSCARLAHYSKGACANVGAAAAAEVLKSIERHAVESDFGQCTESLHALTRQLDLLRSEAAL